MKILKITESQYKRLVRKKNLLKEQFKKIIFNDPNDMQDAHTELFKVLEYLKYITDSTFNKDLYVKEIKNGKAYLDETKYTAEEIQLLKKKLNTYLERTTSLLDKSLTSDLGFDSGFDADGLGYGNIATIDDDGSATKDIDDNSDVAEIDDDDDVAFVDYSNEFACISSKWSPLFKLISKGESSSYESLFPGTTISKKYRNSLDGRNPLDMTIKEVLDIVDPSGGDQNTAVGRWQFTYLRSQAKKAGFDIETDLFSKCNQDKIAMSIVERRDITLDLIKNNPKRAALELAKIWAALPVLEETQGDSMIVKRGQSYYAGDGINKAHIKPNEVESVFKSMVGSSKLCSLSSAQQKEYDDNIDDDNVNDFREWVNSDSNILGKVNKKLIQCGYTDGFSETGESNEYTKIAFGVVGKEWLKSLKEVKPFNSKPNAGESNIIKLLNKGNPYDSNDNVLPNCLDKRIFCLGGKNGDWDGAIYKAALIASYVNQCESKLKPGSQKRKKRLTASGNKSDHWVKSENSYAIDIPTYNKELGDKAFYCLKNILTNNNMISGKTLENFKGERGYYNNFNYEGYRYQILWRSDSDHDDHIHVGVRKN